MGTNAQKNSEHLSNKNEECDNIKYIPQSSKPDFKPMLAGVKGITIMSKPEINGQVPAYKALEEYLDDMGFEYVRYLKKDMELPKNTCEEVYVDLVFNYDFEKFYDIKMVFVVLGGEGNSWTFSTNKTAKAGYNSDPKYNFGQALRDMYHYKKISLILITPLN